MLKRGIFFQKLNFLAQIELFDKNQHFGQKRNFCEISASKFWVTIEMFLKYQNVWSKVQVLFKSPSFGQKSKFWTFLELF